MLRKKAFYEFNWHSGKRDIYDGFVDFGVKGGLKKVVGVIVKE